MSGQYQQQQYPGPDQFGHVPPPAPVSVKKKRRWPWVVGGVLAIGLIGNALNGEDPAEPPAAADPTTEETTVEPEPTTTEPEEAETAPEPEPTTEEPEPEPTTEEAAVWDSTGYEETMLVLEMTWESTDAEAREDICFGWNVLGEDYTVDTLNEEGTFNEDAIRDFFSEECE